MAHELNQNLMRLLCSYKLANDQYPLNITEQEVALFINELKLSLVAVADFKGLLLEAKIEQNTIGHFDHTLIWGVLRDAVHNSFKFAKHKIIIAAKPKGSGVLITIADDGPGFPQHMLGPINELHQTMDFEQNNTGLGMHFAKIITDLHSIPSNDATIFLTNGGLLNVTNFL